MRISAEALLPMFDVTYYKSCEKVAVRSLTSWKYCVILYNTQITEHAVRMKERDLFAVL